MRFAIVLGGLAIGAALAACAGTQSVSPVRDVTGRALPTYARLESPFLPIEVHCGQQRFYVVDDVDKANLGSRSYRTTPHRFEDLTANELCERITAYRESGQN